VGTAKKSGATHRAYRKGNTAWLNGRQSQEHRQLLQRMLAETRNPIILTRAVRGVDLYLLPIRILVALRGDAIDFVENKWNITCHRSGVFIISDLDF
jgi:hypothetical protein